MTTEKVWTRLFLPMKLCLNGTKQLNLASLMNSSTWKRSIRLKGSNCWISRSFFIKFRQPAESLSRKVIYYEQQICEYLMGWLVGDFDLHNGAFLQLSFLFISISNFHPPLLSSSLSTWRHCSVDSGNKSWTWAWRRRCESLRCKKRKWMGWWRCSPSRARGETARGFHWWKRCLYWETVGRCSGWKMEASMLWNCWEKEKHQRQKA